LAERGKYRSALNLGILGFHTLLSLFDIATGKENVFQGLNQDKLYNYSVGTLIDRSIRPSFDVVKAKNTEEILLTLKIYADKQYDYDQNIYLAEGNVKLEINGGILKSDLLRYEKLTGIISAEGNVSFTKGSQHFIGKLFRFNLLKKEGIIENVYGILDIKNVLKDLKINTNNKKQLVQNRSLNNQEKTFYDDGIEFDFGNTELPSNKITRSNKATGAINNWRFKSDLITIREKGWESKRITFTNDPFDPHQISFQGIDVIAEEEDGELLITSAKTNLILGSRNKFFLGKRIFGAKKRENKFELIFDSKDRDGLVLTRTTNSRKINNNIKLDYTPQFLINRALIGKTYSYNEKDSKDDKSIKFSDLFGLNIKLKADYKDWEFDSSNDLSTLNTERIFRGLRHSATLRKHFKMPILDYSSFNIFTNYRSRAWNGTFGETEIRAAYGGFIEKTKSFQSGEVKNTLNLRFGSGKYKAERLSSNEIISLLRSSVFASLDSEYEIWKMSRENINQNKGMVFSPILINPELLFRTSVKSAFFNYEDGSNQSFVKFSFGPEIRLGRLEKKFLDYTKLSVMPGIKFKAGNSPFKFDNAIDLRTVEVSFLQQIYGPLMFDIVSNINIDSNSENHGEYYNTKLGLLWHQRAYEFGVYYHPDNEAGGFYFRINGFDFDNSVKAVF
tara:strand:- start:1380 stop:3401 length:2022 start_codon:yes stop_codon:yes gene_type:complete